MAQCPPNIGFEDGTFTGWDCYAGTIDKNGVVSVNYSGPVSGRHTMLQSTYPQTKAPYGHFPVNCPNGSKYSIQLGNNQTGAQAERVSYTFTIPIGQDNYSIIYNYAVVFENPSHAAYQQPRFTSKVYDVSAGAYITCGAFDFVASAGLPGFIKSGNGTDVYYKDWSPITVKLLGYGGKTIRLEFTTNDCTVGGHFGYAYIDVNENCTSPVSGNVFCGTPGSITLTAPFGFNEYHWFNADFSQELGTENTLKLSPAPAPGTVYALEIVPYPGLGCLDTIYTTIKALPNPFDFNVASNIHSCLNV